MINKETLELLGSLRDLSSKRSTILLRDHSVGCADWAYWVPPSFNSALDIKLTPRVLDGRQVLVWTQGGLFSFASGDILHLQSDGSYLQSLECVQVVTGTPDYYAEDSGYISGRVEFDQYSRRDLQSQFQKVRRHSLTQLDFLRLLISGQYS
jgi:hypothetical protein